MNTVQISIEANVESQELLISRLMDFGATGFEQTDSHLLAYFDELNFDSYAVSKIISSFPHQINILEEKNWNEEWERNFQPVQVSNFCGVRAEFHPPFTGVQHEIVITPKMSFGTGHHATTYMMIEQMEAIPLAGKTVFDFGTGTGILAILAEKRGAERIFAIDVDDWSIKNTNENVERNNCKRVEVQLTSALPHQQFDVILANINRNVILEYIDNLIKISKSGGQILFSGLLKSDRDEIVKVATSHDLSLIRELERDNWISLLFVKV